MAAGFSAQQSQGSLGNLFKCSESIETMLEDLKKELAAAEGKFPIEQDAVSKVHSALLYVALDSGSFHHILINAKNGSHG